MSYYGTLEQANSYLNTHFRAFGHWNNLDDTVKERLLSSAFHVLENQIWIGTKLDPSTQEERFPRDYTNYIDTLKYCSWMDEFQLMFRTANKQIPEYILKAQWELIANFLVYQDFEQLRALKEIGSALTGLDVLSFDPKEKVQKFPLPDLSWGFAKFWHTSFWGEDRPQRMVSSLDYGYWSY